VAKGYTTRKLEVFTVAAFVKDAAKDRPADYAKLLAQLASLPPRSRATRVGDRFMALQELQAEPGGAYWFLLISGIIGKHPQVYDSATGELSVETLGEGEIEVESTHGYLDPVRREVIIEFNKLGGKAKDVVTLIEDIARRKWPEMELSCSLTPKVESTFLDALRGFRRVRLATVRLAKPNHGWADAYEGVANVAEESDGKYFEIEVVAVRGGSLSLTRGIMDHIRRFIGMKHSPLMAVKVAGNRSEEEAESSISLLNYHVHQRVNVRMTDDGHVDAVHLHELAREFLASRPAGG
jgi:hypothetical protein